jgi:hypothetical protein
MKDSWASVQWLIIHLMSALINSLAKVNSLTPVICFKIILFRNNKIFCAQSHHTPAHRFYSAYARFILSLFASTHISNCKFLSLRSSQFTLHMFCLHTILWGNVMLNRNNYNLPFIFSKRYSFSFDIPFLNTLIS